MNTLNFYIDNYTDKKGLSQITCKLGKQIKRLPLKIPSKYWDRQKQIVTKSYIHWYVINQKLLSLRTHIENKLIELPSANLISIVDEFFGKKNTDSIKLCYCLEQMTEQMKLSVSKTYLNKFEVMKLDLIRSGLYGISAKEINLEHFEILKNTLIPINNNNTLERKLRAFKGFLNWIDNNIVKLDKSWHKEAKNVKLYKAEMIALNENELQRILQLDLKSQFMTLEHYRDIFIFGCMTGARFSDIKYLKFTDIINDVWNLRVKKTKDYIQIPLNEIAKGIIAKYYDYNSLKVPSNNAVNENIKEICKLAGINEPVKITNIHGSKATDLIFSKYELISMHTARRTFITIALTKGIPAEIVMKISGHSNYHTFKKYVRFSSEVVKNTFLKKFNNL